MPAYDPKRPRPSAATEEVAPIDALLDPTGADEPTPDPAADAAATDDAAENHDPAATDDAAEASAVAVGDSGAIEEVDLRVDPGPDASEPLLQAGGSEVPVAPAPEENTANRAVLAAVLVVVAALIAVVVVVRRRRD